MDEEAARLTSETRSGASLRGTEVRGKGTGIEEGEGERRHLLV